MKRLFILFFLAVIGQALIAQYGSLQNVTNICYEEEYSERIRITGELNTSTLTVFDKLKFTNKKYVQTHHEYLNASGFATHDRNFVAHENMFPKWYSHPVMIRNDESGMTSYFSNNNEYLPDGWTGGAVSETQHGTYMTDNETGQRYYQEDYSAQANEHYTAHDSLVKSIGYLYNSVFKTPDATVLGQLENEGYLVSNDGNVITVKNFSMTLVWDVGQKVFVTQLVEEGSPIKTSTSYFTYYEAFNDFLISKTITVVPATFDNGDCFETVSETTYTNYSSNCQDPSISLKRNEKQANPVNELSIYPNPASNSINLQIPFSERSSVLKMVDLSGKVMVQRKIPANSTRYELNVSNLPMGMYLVKMQQGDEIYSIKFVKQ